MQIREGGTADVDEIVAVTMAPSEAGRALNKAVARRRPLGAFTDEALAGSESAQAPARSRRSSRPSRPTSCCSASSPPMASATIGAVVADHLKCPRSPR